VNCFRSWGRLWSCVDLLPDGEGGWVVLELNGAVELTHEYGIGLDPFAAAASELARVAVCRQAA